MTIIDAELVVAYGVRGGTVSDVTLLDGVFAERGNLSITRCEIDGGGASTVFGASGERVILTDSLITGFPRYGTIAENLTVPRSTVVGNGGSDGGGVRILKLGRILQSTIAGNHSNGSGGRNQEPRPARRRSHGAVRPRSVRGAVGWGLGAFAAPVVASREVGAPRRDVCAGAGPKTARSARHSWHAASHVGPGRELHS